MSTPDLLPESRLSTPRGARPGPLGVEWVPIFCANCGREGGRVPAVNITWAFWLCQKCFETYGTVAGLLAVKDEVVWEQVRQDQLGRAAEAIRRGDVAP